MSLTLLPTELLHNIFPYYLKDNAKSGNFYPNHVLYNIFMGFACTQLSRLSSRCSLDFPLYHCIRVFLQPFAEQEITESSLVNYVCKGIMDVVRSFKIATPPRVLGHEDIAAMNASIEDASLETLWKAVIEQLQQGDDSDDEDDRIDQALLQSLDPEMKAPEIRELMKLDSSFLKYVKRLDLSGLDLYSLPKEIGLLTNIEELDLKGNYLVTLPAELAQLQKMTALCLSANAFETIPVVIQSLPQLEQLIACNNPLKTVPIEIFDLVNLTKLVLTECDLSEISSKIKNLQNLETLGLRGNPRLMSIPAEIALIPEVNGITVSEHTAVPEELKDRVWQYD